MIRLYPKITPFKTWFMVQVLMWSSMIYSTEYLYPVGHLNKEGEKLLLMYQKSMHHIELWQWDPVTLETRKALLSSYTPAGISLLPDGSGFSFIDNDTIRIAYTHKRSPTLIPLYEPLYDFTTVTWFSAEHCILSAKEKEQYGIYIINKEGQCYQVLRNNNIHYKYPYLIDNELFYIQVDDNRHTLMQTSLDLYPLTLKKNITADEVYSLSNERLICNSSAQIAIMPFIERSIAFLRMIDREHGFYLEHPTAIDRHDTRITFDYFSITKEQDDWQEKQLFSFSLPMAYLMSADERIYESILPFLPTLQGTTLFYFDCKEGAIATQLWKYDLITQEQTQLTQSPHSTMGIYLYNDKIWYGGVLSAWVNDQEQLCVTIPNVA